MRGGKFPPSVSPSAQGRRARDEEEERPARDGRHCTGRDVGALSLRAFAVGVDYHTEPAALAARSEVDDRPGSLRWRLPPLPAGPGRRGPGPARPGGPSRPVTRLAQAP